VRPLYSLSMRRLSEPLVAGYKRKADCSKRLQ